MSDLFDKSIRTLELPRVLELLSEQAVSAEAKQRALRLRPETEPEEVLRLLDQTDAARNLIGLRGSPSFSGVKPVAEALDLADRGGALNTRELLTIADLLTAARRAKEYFNDEAAEKTAIDHLFLSLHGNRFLEEKIKRAIPDEDTIADAASTELVDIRRHMRAAQAKSRQILQKIISSPSYGKILQETIITQRDGRFVVPVKAEHKGDLPGLVHDISSTGATLFVEPMGVVQANNEYIELQAKEQKEIDRILAEFSAEAAAHREDIQWDYDTLVHLDLIFARGQLSYKMNAVRPEVRRDGAIHLRKARHPLLDPKTAVPIDIELGDTFDTLVITGPNTGGKTVTLKTLGLLTLMTQCGLHIPAADRSAVSVYERVLADIGDEQSIEQSLSTFSAHMVNIVEILKEADRHSLVLFDELGAGTDPVEGAALAREQGCDLVIGMGGGSMMDAAKAVAFCAVNGGDVNDYISGGKQGTGCLPILEVPTTCGTGSEANPFAVLTNPETKDKKSLWGDLIYPKVSFIDPELMKTMPKEVLASVGFDALSHNMEGYLATRSQPITDQLALHAIRLTAGSLPKVYHGEGTQEDWENITLASLLGGIVINTAGVGGGHGMEHPVSGMYNVVHGKGLAALTPPLFRHSYNTKPERYAAISRLLGGKDETDCAEAVERFLKSIDLNCKLRELGVEEYGIDWMTDNCINVFAGSMRNHTKALTRDEVKQIYLEAF